MEVSDERRWDVQAHVSPAHAQVLEEDCPGPFAERNRVRGRVISIRYGLTRITMQVRAEAQPVIRVRRALSMPAWPPARIGDWVELEIPEEAVLVGIAGVWPGKPRGNRWAGRIVLVGPAMEPSRLIVKLKGAPMTLCSRTSVFGLAYRPQTGDRVMVSVDPERIEVRAVEAPGRVTLRNLEGTMRPDSWLPGWNGAIRLNGVVRSVCRSTDRDVLALQVGGASLTASVDRIGKRPIRWETDLGVELRLTEREAWIRPAGCDGEPVPCVISY